MPWVEPKFAPGIVKDRTTLSAQPGWVDGQWVRFKGRWPESIGGWATFALSSLGAAARAVHTWTLRDGTKRAAVGTTGGLYVINEAGTVTNITPSLSAMWDSATIALVNAQLYATITVPSGHGLTTGDVLTIPGWSKFASALVTAGAVTKVSDTVFTVVSADPGSTSTTTYSDLQYFATISTFEDWSLDNFGQNLVALRKNGALFEWDPSATATNLVSSGFSSTLWTPGSWAQDTPSPGIMRLTSGTDQPITLAAGTLVSGTHYRMTYQINSGSGAGTVRVVFSDGAGGYVDIGAASLSQSTTVSQGSARTFDFTAPNNLSLIILGTRSSGNIDLSGFTIQSLDDAVTVSEAPNRSKFMFVDSNRIIVLLGTVDEADVYNDLNVRWSGQANSAQWTPDTTNLSRSYPVQEGSTFVGAVRSRGQNLLFTDTGVMTMAFTGDLATVFSILPLAGNCGLIGPHAVVESNGDVFWLSNNNNFYRFQGGKPDPIRCEIRKDVTEHIEPDYKSRCFAWLNATFQEVWWHYPDTRDEAEECSRYAMVSVPSIDGDITVWSSGTSDRTAGNGSTNFDYPILADASGNVFFHENGYTADGSGLESFVKSAFFTSSTGTNLFRMKRIIPDFREQEGAIIFTGYGKMFPNSPEFQLRQPTPCVPERQKVDVRWTSRLFAIEMSSTKRWELGYLQFEAEDSGAQR